MTRNSCASSLTTMGDFPACLIFKLGGNTIEPISPSTSPNW